VKRGNLLWTGSRMMLAEHRQLLNQRLQEKTEEDLQREQDEQQLEAWQEMLNEAVTYRKKVVIRLKGEAKKEVTGFIVDWDTEQRILYIQADDQERIKAYVDYIADFKLV